MTRGKDNARKFGIRLTVLMGLLSLAMLGLVPLMILWPEKPNWPEAMTAFTYVLAGLMSLIPSVGTYICYRGWRNLVDREKSDEISRSMPDDAE